MPQWVVCVRCAGRGWIYTDTSRLAKMTCPHCQGAGGAPFGCF